MKISRLFFLPLLLLSISGSASAGHNGAVTLSDLSTTTVRSLFVWFKESDGSLQVDHLYCNGNALRLYTCSFRAGASHGSHGFSPVTARIMVSVLSSYVEQQTVIDEAPIGTLLLTAYYASRIDCPASGNCTLTAK